ncbi:site-2 protease family protein [Candidatus Berkelbacteria bacterium]|nr:site-2 protease family protein [Candidatus Berkelbacteria bacterium]
MIITTLVFLLIIGILVFVHELGHFLVAKRNGILVEEFAFGFKPRLWGKKIGETVYAINLIPLGGYVKLYGEGEGETGERSFKNKTLFQRFQVLVAGSAMNLMLGFLVLTILFGVGFQPIFPGVGDNPFIKEAPSVVIEQIAPNSPASLSGLQPGDRVVTLDGNKASIYELIAYVSQNIGKEVTLVVNRNGTEITKKLLARKEYPQGQGPLGIALENAGEAKSSILLAPASGAYETGKVIGLSVKGFALFVKDLVVKQEVSDDVTGLIGVGAVTGVARRMGIEYLAQLLVVISIGLGVINLMPIMPLDGGHVVALGYQKVFGRPLSEKQMGYFVTFGLAFVILMFLVVTYKDFIRFDVLNRLF